MLGGLFGVVGYTPNMKTDEHINQQILYIYGNNNARCYSNHTTREKNTTKLSAPEDGHKVARNMLSNL